MAIHSYWRMVTQQRKCSMQVLRPNCTWEISCRNAGDSRSWFAYIFRIWCRDAGEEQIRFHWPQPLYQLLHKRLYLFWMWTRTRSFKDGGFRFTNRRKRWSLPWRNQYVISHLVIITTTLNFCNLPKHFVDVDFGWLAVCLPSRNGQDCNVRKRQIQ